MNTPIRLINFTGEPYKTDWVAEVTKDGEVTHLLMSWGRGSGQTLTLRGLQDGTKITDYYPAIIRKEDLLNVTEKLIKEAQKESHQEPEESEYRITYTVEEYAHKHEARPTKVGYGATPRLPSLEEALQGIAVVKSTKKQKEVGSREYREHLEAVDTVKLAQVIQQASQILGTTTSVRVAREVKNYLTKQR